MCDTINAIISDLLTKREITETQLDYILNEMSADECRLLYRAARSEADRVYGKRVFMRGLIEFSSHCKNDCNYCGLRRSHRDIARYRMDEATILQCCQAGYLAGTRTFVLQSGEDSYWTDDRLCRLVATIASSYPDCAITLSVGERSRQSYQRLFDSGANRYLLRHETALPEHYALLHPLEMSFDRRIECLYDLKDIGYQVGCGFMVGTPGQTTASLYADMCLIKSLQPQMVGIGPFIATQGTPFANEPSGSVSATLRLLSVVRLIHPHVLLPSTTALGSMDALGREKGILAGANVVMPNLSPIENRELYRIYDNKICLGDGIDHCRTCIERRVSSTGCELVVDRGDYMP